MNPVAGDTQEGNLSESVAESPQGAAPVARHRLRVGSLFSGYGGAEMAVQAVWPDAEPAWFVEYDKAPSAVLAHHWPDVPNYGDVTTVDWSSLERVDILTAGWPCQPFSHAGQRRGTDDERHLWPYVAAAVRVLRPRYLLGENVAGHLSLGFDTVLADLAALGFDVRWGVVRASDAGAPHRRARLFIVATTDADCIGGDRAGVHGQGERGWPESADGSHATADASGQRHGPGQDRAGLGRLDGRDARSARQRQRSREESGDRSAADRWGTYTAAIRRWEHVLGRRAPAPTEPGRTGPRLSPRFVEWMQGLPDGWVTDTSIPRAAQLKALGNGIVPAQAALALRLLLDDEVAA